MTAKTFRYFTALVAIGVCEASVANAQVLAANPTPEMYVANNKGGSSIVPNGQLRFDGISFSCGSFPTVEDPLLNDYAAAPWPVSSSQEAHACWERRWQTSQVSPGRARYKS
jgi:hypothetical protein